MFGEWLCSGGWLALILVPVALVMLVGIDDEEVKR